MVSNISSNLLFELSLKDAPDSENQKSQMTLYFSVSHEGGQGVPERLTQH